MRIYSVLTPDGLGFQDVFQYLFRAGCQTAMLLQIQILVSNISKLFCDPKAKFQI